MEHIKDASDYTTQECIEAGGHGWFALATYSLYCVRCGAEVSSRHLTVIELGYFRRYYHGNTGKELHNETLINYRDQLAMKIHPASVECSGACEKHCLAWINHAVETVHVREELKRNYAEQLRKHVAGYADALANDDADAVQKMVE